MSSDLDLRTDSLGNRTDDTNTDIRIGQYEFFAEHGENRYIVAAKGAQAKHNKLREEIFTPGFHGGANIHSNAGRVQEMSILETSPEYTQGLYDETGIGDAGTVLLVLLFAGISAVTFFITRVIHRQKRRRTEV